MVWVSSPGICAQEASSGVSMITSVATPITACCGRTAHRPWACRHKRPG